MLGFLAYSSSPRWFPELVSRERGFFALVVAVWFSAPGDGACVVEFEFQTSSAAVVRVVPDDGYPLLEYP